MFGARAGQRGYDEDARVPGFVEQLGQGLEAVHPGHVEIEQDDVDAVLGQEREGRLGAVDRGAQEHFRGVLDQARQRGARDERIVDDHQPHGLRRGGGGAWRTWRTWRAGRGMAHFRVGNGDVGQAMPTSWSFM